jgi:5-hydroxyisourate hydrolase-like protein (transthyretin family)
VALPEAGKYQLRLTSRDCLPVDSAPIVFTAGGVPPPPADLLMWPAAVLEVAIQDGRGRPVPGYEVIAVPWDGTGEGPKAESRKVSPRQSTNDQGIVRLNLGPGGSYLVGSGATTWLDSQRLKVEPGSPVYRQYSLPATGELEIEIVDEAGQPLPGVQVEVRSAKGEKGHAVQRRAGTRGGGSNVVTIENLPVGDYSIRLRRRNYVAEVTDAHVRGNVTERLQLEMRPRQPQVKAGPP